MYGFTQTLFEGIAIDASPSVEHLLADIQERFCNSSKHRFGDAQYEGVSPDIAVRSFGDWDCSGKSTI